MTKATPARTAADLASRIQQKELGYFSHFLDAVWDNLGKSTIFAVGIAAGSGYLNDGITPLVFAGAALSGVLPGAAKGLLRMLDASDDARAHDSPRVQQFIRDVQAKAAGAVASQRGSVWLVREPGQAGVAVMNGREYDRYKRDAASKGMELDEIILRRGEATLTRYSGGKIDAGTRLLPAAIRVDLDSGRPSWAGWFLGGRQETRATVVRAAATRSGYSASRFLSGGTGVSQAKAPDTPAYSASRFLSGGSGHNADEVAAPAFGR